jgi:sortase A
LGIVIISYPKATEIYSIHKQQKLIETWQASLNIIDQGNVEEGEDSELYIEAEQLVNQNDIQNTDSEEKLNEERDNKAIEKEKREKEEKEKYINENMEGLLIIKSINLQLPILKGATEKNMQISVASLEHTVQPGEIGNYAIAGHRNRTYGRNFNRLDEVEKGDLIEINDGKNSYNYIVVEKLYVYPDETWVLNSDNDKSEITLITCHPVVDPTHRLIIKGEIVE